MEFYVTFLQYILKANKSQKNLEMTKMERCFRYYQFLYKSYVVLKEIIHF